MITRTKTRPLARFFLTLALTTGCAAGLSACNTMRGAGQDVSSIGHDVSNGANGTQQAWHNAQPSAATH